MTTTVFSQSGMILVVLVGSIVAAVAAVAVAVAAVAAGAAGAAVAGGADGVSVAELYCCTDHTHYFSLLLITGIVYVFHCCHSFLYPFQLCCFFFCQKHHKQQTTKMSFQK